MSFGAAPAARRGGVLPWILALLPAVWLTWTAHRSLANWESNSRRQLLEAVEAEAFAWSRRTAPATVLPGMIDQAARHGRSGLVRIITLLERRNPGSYRWLWWDDRGELVAIGGPSLAGRRRWQEVVRLALRRGPAPGGPAPDIAQFRAARRLLAGIFGPNFPIDELLESPSTGIVGTWLGRPCLLVRWTPSPAARHRCNLDGGLCLVDLGALPPGQWLRDAISVIDIETPPTAGRGAILIDLDHWRRSRVTRGLPSHRGFLHRLAAAWRDRSANPLQVDGWLAVEVTSDRLDRQRLFSVASTRALTDTTNRLRWCLGLAALALTLAGAGAARHAQQLPVSRWNFRHRIASTFVLAMVLPTIALVDLGSAMLSAEHEALASRDRERLDAAAQRLEDLHAVFRQRHGQSLRRSLGQDLRNDPTPAGLWVALQKLRASRRASSVHLLDSRTRRAISRGPPRRLRALQGLSDLMQMQIHNRPIGQTQRIIDRHPRTLVPLDDLTVSRIHNFETLTQTGAVWVRREPHFVTIEVEPGLLERWLVAWLMRRPEAGRVLDDGDPEAPIAVRFWTGDRLFPAQPLLTEWLQRAGVRQNLARGVAGHAEVPLGSTTWRIRWSDTGSFREIRPILMTPTSSREALLAARRRQVGTAIATSAGMGVALGLLLAGTLLAPLAAISTAVRRVNGGDYTVVLPVDGCNEIGRLQASFNAMVRGMRERQQMGTFVSAAVIETIKAPDPEGADGVGRTCEVTVLFSHVREFTTWWIRQEPSLVFAMLDRLLATADRCVRHHGGEIDKFIGDAVMAVFRRPDHAAAGVRCALDLQAAVAQLAREREASGQPGVRIGIGVNTGPVIMGAIGSERRKDLTVIGDTVNLAARLEALASSHHQTGIIISAATFAASGLDLVTRRLPPTRVKGKQQRLEVYELLSCPAGPVRR